MYRHLSSFRSIMGVTNALVDDQVNVVTSPVMGALLTILCVDEIFGLETGSRAKNTCALTERCHIERDFTLNDKKQGYLVP